MNSLAIARGDQTPAFFPSLPMKECAIVHPYLVNKTYQATRIIIEFN